MAGPSAIRKFSKRKLVRKLHPLNSIFGRLFLWFWLTTILMILCTALIIRQMVKGPDLQTIPAGEQQILESAAAKLAGKFYEDQNHPRKNSQFRPRRLNRVLGEIAQNTGENLVLLDISTDEIFHNGPRIPFPFQQRFRNLSQADTPYGFMMGSRVFFGPVKLTIDDKQYALFKGKRAAFPMLRQNSEWLLIMAITVSGLLCFFLAWSFTRPIKELRDASQQMAKGNLQAGTSANIHRRDEIGDLSEDFRTMAIKVNELLDHQKRLLADISHELRSPLARLQLAIGIAHQSLENAQSIQDVTGSEKTHRQVLERIDKEATQIDNMIGRVLQLSRLESNTQDIIRNKVIFPSFIGNVMQDAEYEAQNKGKKLLQRHCPDIEVVIEPNLIASAVENVLRNAIRYAKTTVEVSSKVKGSLLLICIADDGCGVPGSELEKLFTPFYRVSLARNRDSGGTGLGLAIAIQAVSAHNGRISASNIKKGGLSVEIELPLLDS